MPPCRRAGAALPGRFAETKDSCPPTGQLEKKFAEVVGLRIPTLARAWQAGGSDAGQVARQECGALGIEASDAGQECDARKHKWHLCF